MANLKIKTEIKVKSQLNVMRLKYCDAYGFNYEPILPKCTNGEYILPEEYVSIRGNVLLVIIVFAGLNGSGWDAKFDISNSFLDKQKTIKKNGEANMTTDNDNNDLTDTEIIQIKLNNLV